MENIFFDIGLIIIIATLGGFLVRLIKQPFIPAYVITGVIIGPVLGLVTDYEIVTVFRICKECYKALKKDGIFFKHQSRGKVRKAILISTGMEV